MPETSLLLEPAGALPAGDGLLTEVSRKWMEAMRRGDFEAAWRQTDRIEFPRRRAEALGGFVRQPHHLLWNGDSFAGRRVLIKCEHGLGDTLQFARYCSVVRREARQVILKAQPMLLSLLEGMEGVDLLVDAWTTDPDPPHDVAIECMELAYAFRHTPDTLPARIPYLPVDAICRTAPPEQFGRSPALRVGLIWASSGWDSSRSVRLRDLEPLGEAAEGARFFALQQGPEVAETDSAPFPIEPLSHRTQEIRDAAAAMLQLDLIVTVDSMTAHLAGALGRPVWVLLKHDADWRWMEQRADTPWYPTMRLFRQPRERDWRGAIERMAEALRQLSLERTS